MSISRKVGYEVELLAPPQKSRRDLANLFAEVFQGEVLPFFSQQSELGATGSGDKRSFANLTPGFKVTNHEGNWALSFVDDITIQEGLDRTAPSLPGWFRIIADDPRFLQLVTLHCKPDANAEELLTPFAQLFATKVQKDAHGIYATQTLKGETLCLQSGLPGERERPCEVITAPLSHSSKEVLTLTLDVSQSAGFTLAKEAATHIHFDASRLQDGAVFGELIKFFSSQKDKIRSWAQTNSRCSRIKPYSSSLVEKANSGFFHELPWQAVKKAALKEKVSKYCDVNFKNMVSDDPLKNTIEIRMLPGTLDPELIHHWTLTFDKLLSFLESGGKSEEAIKFFG